MRHNVGVIAGGLSQDYDTIMVSWDDDMLHYRDYEQAIITTDLSYLLTKL